MPTGTMLYNPFNGLPRHPDDIASDPEGRLLWDGTTPLRAETIRTVEDDARRLVERAASLGYNLTIELPPGQPPRMGYYAPAVVTTWAKRQPQ